MRALTRKPETIDEYLDAVTDAQRVALEKLRKAIAAAAPGAVECISYSLPAFKFGGRMLVAFGAAKTHCAFYPGAYPIELFADELIRYDTSKGTIRFAAAKPLPVTLVRKIVKAQTERLHRRSKEAGSARPRKTRRDA
jgi:uncharacterized protein YdhG (YjbR/CyaY superfamily)